MTIKYFIIIIITGIVAGFINVNAGGGSLITIPILIFTGLPSATANGTNRIALAIANIIAVFNFKKNGFFNWKLALFLAIPASIGAIIGSFISVTLSDTVYNTILAFVIFFVIAVIIIDPKRFINHTIIKDSIKNKVLGIIIFFILGIYGGVIQAGVGFLIISSLIFLTGFSLAKINSIKVLIVLIYMSFSIVIFIISNNVNWIYALVLSIGNGIGAYLGSIFAIKHGDKWIKVILIISALGMAIKLLNIF